MARGIEPKPSNSDDNHLFDAQIFSFSEEENRELLSKLAQLDEQAQLREDENDEEHALLVDHEHKIYDRIDPLHPDVARIHKVLYAMQAECPDYDTMRLEEDLTDVVVELELADAPAEQFDQVQRLLDITVSMRLLIDATAFQELATKQDVQRMIHLSPGLDDSDKSILLAAAETLLDGDSLDMHDVDTASRMFYAEDERKKNLQHERTALRDFHNWSLQHFPDIDTRSDNYHIVACYIRRLVIDGAYIAIAEPVDTISTLGIDIEAFHQLLLTFDRNTEPRAPMV